MHPRCEIVAKYILPIFRSIVAKELIEKYNFTQVAAAEKLGTTQAAISQFIHSKRGHKNVEQFGDILEDVQSAAIETAKSIAMGKMGADEVTAKFCELCTKLREEKKLLVQ